jgi:hypothetical protein
VRAKSSKEVRGDEGCDVFVGFREMGCAFVVSRDVGLGVTCK